MKKNLMSVIILALCLVNFVMTALLTFSILPSTKNANKLIEKVCNAIYLDLNSGSATGASSVPIDEQEVYSVKEGANMIITLKSEGGDPHYLSCLVTLSLNTNSDNYTKYSPSVLAQQDSVIQDEISSIVSNYTDKEVSDPNKLNEIKDEVLVKLQKMFGQDYIIRVNFASPTIS